MRVHVETTGLHEVIDLDGRHTAAQQWHAIAEHVDRVNLHRTTPLEVTGAYVITDNPNRRPHYRPGDKLRK